jgi:hypothetical protein
MKIVAFDRSSIKDENTAVLIMYIFVELEKEGM